MSHFDSLSQAHWNIGVILLVSKTWWHFVEKSQPQWHRRVIFSVSKKDTTIWRPQSSEIKPDIHRFSKWEELSVSTGWWRWLKTGRCQTHPWPICSNHPPVISHQQHYVDRPCRRSPHHITSVVSLTVSPSRASSHSARSVTPSVWQCWAVEPAVVRNSADVDAPPNFNHLKDRPSLDSPLSRCPTSSSALSVSRQSSSRQAAPRGSRECSCSIIASIESRYTIYSCFPAPGSQSPSLPSDSSPSAFRSEPAGTSRSVSHFVSGLKKPRFRENVLRFYVFLGFKPYFRYGCALRGVAWRGERNRNTIGVSILVSQPRNATQHKAQP